MYFLFVVFVFNDIEKVSNHVKDDFEFLNISFSPYDWQEWDDLIKTVMNIIPENKFGFII